ncbi:MAG TPA: YggS family pyridoxal phosphate-dependent enzyme [Bacteroidales bacterium]|jgi:pyridoxal phosphate enzyme (YggS family)|nr:YggS family pyridoxal phosphate-dependent enzyme [Bacteroidales bacterium]HRS98475.1 YggS family pyridoxal phosphate-dependent enzyme [Bacteroidales bacterium]
MSPCAKMNNISENIKHFKSLLPENVLFIAVSKTQPIEAIKEAYQAGQRNFGENKVQEMLSKHEQLKHLDINWHLIGHLQTNKVKYIVPFVKLIHSVDSLKLLQEINKQSLKLNKITECLLQFHIAEEDTKFGLDYDEAVQILNSEEYKAMQNVRICGVMGMATFTEDMERVRREFKSLKLIFDSLKENFFKNNSDFKEVSMGMSGDWQIAVEEGSTMIRIGTSIFGERNYNT